MASKYVFVFLFAFCTVQCLDAEGLGSDIIDTLLKKTIPSIERYFNPFSDVAKHAIETVKALLNDLNTKSGTYLLDASTAFQTLKNVITNLQPRLAKIGEDISTCIITDKGNVSDIIRAAEKGAQTCAQGLVAQIQPLADDISQTATQIQGVSVKLAPTITNCVTTNLDNPVALSRCLTKILSPVFAEVSKVASDIKSALLRYEQQNTEFKSQLQQCSAQLQATVATAESLVDEVQQCVASKEQNTSSA